MNRSKDRDWMVRAKCRGTGEDDLYASDNRGGGQIASADRLCGGCRVRVECARYALSFDNPRGMIWAGVPVPDSGIAGFRAAMKQIQITADLPTEAER
ncbi:WhiB family transcriptional regulator [Rhodococcus qingshengii]|uniref:WhiB family transcriptional regulator n=1 Tax=Rhodococcus qingshengii TaxID=334542 RepID=UPI003BAD4095